MNRKEFLIIIAGLKSNYPNWQFNVTDEQTCEFWYENLKDIPYEIMQIGISKLIATEEFYPNIAKIRKSCASITTANTTDATEAWGLVRSAIRNFGYARPEEALDSLPIDVAKSIKYMGGWQVLCESKNIEADRAHFYRTIESICNRIKSESLLSIDLTTSIDKYQQIASNANIAIEINKKKESASKQIGYIEEKQNDTAVITENMESVGNIVTGILGSIGVQRYENNKHLG